MPDMFSRSERSRIMSRIRSFGNTATELKLIRIMRKYRISGWRRNFKLFGHPDFVFPRKRLVVFTDGDFWHGNPRKFRLPGSNIKYWREKILSNMRRDRRVNRILRANGWSVLRFWQSTLSNERNVVSRLRRHLYPSAKFLQTQRRTSVSTPPRRPKDTIVGR
jgi:DNA mismatch endonuclease (patch repair protein)